ncbi:cupin domain-containing protein [Pseudomonas sp. MM211]|uniref:cupin domain-containing protein n=1 Tax=Pseudomonas sp. MM211 TaxID=2866808 RepID=UPI001CEDB38D|nr:cupin domain-containing protein [Pseudomonas sp. MM211]UCJ15769.1 cupin domain-containing protein [Pseudomonas sp. MM211]
MNLIDEAKKLPQAWRSRILGSTAGANLKLIRMDGAGIPYESHSEFDEALLVLEGEMQLELEGEVIHMKSGDFHIVPAGKQHKVLQGSFGILFLVDAE